MTRIRIRRVQRLRRKEVRRLVPGYTSREMLIPRPGPATVRDRVRLDRVRRDTPYRRRYTLPSPEWARYLGFLRQGVSLGAFDAGRLIGLALVEAREAERVLWVWEFGVEVRYRRRGVGTALLRELERRGAAAGYNAIGLETQTTNVPAVDFYHRNGFRVDRIDLELYPKRMADRGEIALVLSKRLRSGSKRQRRSMRRYHDRSRG